MTIVIYPGFDRAASIRTANDFNAVLLSEGSDVHTSSRMAVKLDQLSDFEVRPIANNDFNIVKREREQYRSRQSNHNRKI